MATATHPSSCKPTPGFWAMLRGVKKLFVRQPKRRRSLAEAERDGVLLTQKDVARLRRMLADPSIRRRRFTPRFDTATSAVAAPH